MGETPGTNFLAHKISQDRRKFTLIKTNWANVGFFLPLIHLT